MTNAKEMDKLAAEAKAGSSIADLKIGSATGTVAGHEVAVYANPVNTNGRQLIQLNWYLAGKKVGKAAIAALVEAAPAERELLDSGISDEEHQANVDLLAAAPVEAAPVEAPAETDLKAAIASGLSKCAAMRAVAKGWKGDRKSYLTAMKAEGMNAATSANSWLNGRK